LKKKSSEFKKDATKMMIAIAFFGISSLLFILIYIGTNKDIFILRLLIYISSLYILFKAIAMGLKNL